MSKYKKMKVDLLSAHKVKSKNNIEVRGFSKDSQGKEINNIPVIDEAIFCSGKI